MSKSSFNSKQSSSHSDFHNERTDEPSYILDHSAQNEFTRYSQKSDMLNEAKVTCKTITKRAMQKKAEESFFQEAIINILPHHKTKDIKNLFLSLKKEFNTKAFDLQSVAIHRDEGVFVKTSYPVLDLHYDHNTEKWTHKGKDITGEVEVLRPGKTIFYNPADKGWYSSRKFEQKIDTSSLQKYYNLHAHAVYTRFDFSTGKNIRLDPADMSKIQDITAKELGMERGKQKAKIENLPQFYEKILKEIPPTDNLKDYKKAFIETSKMILKRDYQNVDERTERLEHYELKQRASVAEKPRVIEKEKVVEKERVVVKERIIEKVVQDDTQNVKLRMQNLALDAENLKLKNQEYDFRAMQQRITGLEELDKEQKKELHKLNTQVNKDNTRITELEEKIAELEAKPAKEVEKVVYIQDNTKIAELQEALQSTNETLAKAEARFNTEKQNKAVIEQIIDTPKQEKEGFYSYVKRAYEELTLKAIEFRETITALVQRVSVLEKENAELKIANKNAIKAEMDKLVSTPKVQTALAKTQTPKEQEKVLEKERRIEDLEKHISKLEKRIVGLKEDIGYAEHTLRCTKDFQAVKSDIDYLRKNEGMNWAEKKHAIWAKGEAVKMMEKRLDALYYEKIEPYQQAQKKLSDLKSEKSKVESEISSCEREIKELQKPQEEVQKFNKKHEEEEEHYYQGRRQ